jgi:S1-C subfamily serine protease
MQMLKFPPIFLILAAMSAVAQPAERKVSDPLPDVIDRLRPAVVQIYYRLDQFPPESAQKFGTKVEGVLGTGFVVRKDGYVITALHVVSAFAEKFRGGYEFEGHVYPLGRKRLMVGLQFQNIDSGPLQMRSVFSAAAAEVVDTDEIHDVALLKLEHPFSPQAPISVVTFTVARPVEGHQVAISGYPLGEDLLQTTAGRITSAWDGKLAVQPIPGRPEIKAPQIQDLFDIDARINGGNSGGPVYYGDTGAVIGMVKAYKLGDVWVEGVRPGEKPTQAFDKDTGRPLGVNSGIGVVIPARYIVALLKKNNIEYRENPTVTATSR